MLVAICAVLGLAVTGGRAEPSNVGTRLELNGDTLHLQLQRLSQTLQATHAAKILVIGSSSTVGLGATSASKTYVARLEPDLESAVAGVDFEVVGRGVSGEVAQGAADRMRREVDEVKPDLVIWQVGTNDALGHVDIVRFRACLQKTLSWLKAQKIDVMLINPQYGQSLVKDAFYEQVVTAIAQVAQDAQVPVVDRFGAMRKLEESHLPAVLSADNLHMNDDGYRRLAEQLTAAIVSGLPKDGLTHGTAAMAHNVGHGAGNLNLSGR
jgi:acyl-CoA thioesterase-1